MSPTWELKKKPAGESTVTAEGDTWKDAQRKVFRKLVKKVDLSGFRPGQASEKPVRKQTSSRNILMEAVDEVAGDVLSAGIKEHDLWVISRPVLDIESIDGDKVAFKFNVTVRPEMKLGAYKGLDITKEAVGVNDADVEEEITRLQERSADLIAKEKGKAENGDTAVIGFEGFKKDVIFEGDKGEAYPFVIGSGSSILDFGEQVLGMGIEETKGINVILPEDYQAEELTGRPVVFKATVREIKSKILPGADDELVKQVEIEDVETPGAFREYSRKNLEESKKNQAEQKFENEILTTVIENVEVEIPRAVIEEETDGLVRGFEQHLQFRGFGLEQPKQVTGQTDEAIREEMGKDAFSKIKVRLVLETIVAEEKIEISEEDVNNELENIANMYQMPVEQAKQLISNDVVPYDLRVHEVLGFVKEVAGR